MRFKITLSCKNINIPLSYQYYLSVNIYQCFEKYSYRISGYLHDVGFKSENKVFKHFCFSELFPTNHRVKGSTLNIDGLVEWYVSFGLSEVASYFVKSLLYNNTINILGNVLLIENVESLPSIEFKESVKFKMLSPTVVSFPDERGVPQYCKANNPQLNNILKNNIISKYKSIYKKLPEDKNINFELDQEYINNRGGYDKVSKLITIKEIKVRGFKCPVTIKGNPELIKLAYNSGIGEKNSIGFGMLDVI